MFRASSAHLQEDTLVYMQHALTKALNSFWYLDLVSKYQKEFSAFVNAIDFDDTKQTG